MKLVREHDGANVYIRSAAAPGASSDRFTSDHVVAAPTAYAAASGHAAAAVAAAAEAPPRRRDPNPPSCVLT